MESKLEQLRAARADVLEAAELENLSLPVLQGRRLAAAAQEDDDDGLDEEDEEDDSDHMDVDDDSNQPPSTQKKPKKPSSSSKKKKKVYFDFSVLNDDDCRRDAASRGRREAEMKASMEETGAQLACMAPNLKAVEQYQEVAEREREQMDEVEAARRECKTATETFNSVRQRRFELFNAALTHITTAIDPIYKDLTRSAVHPTGGQAYLSPENTEDPFTAGNHFDAGRRATQVSAGGKLAEAYADLIRNIWSDKYSVLPPTEFKQQLGRAFAQFQGYQQQDSHEMFSAAGLMDSTPPFRWFKPY